VTVAGYPNDYRSVIRSPFRKPTGRLSSSSATRVVAFPLAARRRVGLAQVWLAGRNRANHADVPVDHTERTGRRGIRSGKFSRCSRRPGCRLADYRPPLSSERHRARCSDPAETIRKYPRLPGPAACGRRTSDPRSRTRATPKQILLQFGCAYQRNMAANGRQSGGPRAAAARNAHLYDPTHDRFEKYRKGAPTRSSIRSDKAKLSDTAK